MTTELQPGDVIQDTYRVEARLGQGGMGTTWRGVNLTTQDVVAIKVMAPEIALVPRAVDLFRREAQLLRKVQSDAVIRYETTLQDREGRLYLIMEFVDGQPLSHYLERGARLAPADVLLLGRRIAGALAAIHALGIVHRDVAPDNIMLPDGDIGHCKLIDFGLASNTAGTEASIIGSTYAGKYSYSSPEQFGLHGARVGAASDVYSLGLVLMKVAGLKVPGEGMGIAAVEARRDDLKIPPAAGLPTALRATLEAMLKTRPEERPTDLVQRLTAAAGAVDRGVPRGMARRGILLGLGGVSALAVAGAGLWFALPLLSKDGQGGSSRQVEVARRALDASDPLAEVEALIDSGNLEAALASLIALARNPDASAERRIRAHLALGRMYDPATFDPRRSPFPQPNAAAARRAYEAAAALGSAEAQTALAKLRG
ncbi:serine/threonine protein kinase [Cereibacter sphaeroides]|uniref:serine/threonine-protein kinase n=1 Tax=Cereibacter sphaeroides TaxID=1063 RepID=UPI001F19C623|nr:serine/threonine-protein kinase [Cereibacter sphaeroides]MCE6951777.1 serine/threonine protein kinase [Cereibacter sphaeroides]